MTHESDLGTRLGGAKGLQRRALRRRVEAIISARAKPEDYHALFLELRFRTKGHVKFRDVADFIAHRNVRDRGQIAQLVRDIFVAARVFQMMMLNIVPSPDEAREAAHANLRLATDAAITNYCATSRQSAVKAIDRAADMLKADIYPVEADVNVFNTFGNRLKWHPPYHDCDILDDFVAVLIDNGLLAIGEERELREQGEQLTLYVLALFHGSEIELTTKDRVVLQAGFFNNERRLEVKAHLTFTEFKKPIFMPLCVFLTHLQPEGYCDERLISSEPHGWDMPIRIDENWCLSADEG